MQDNIKLGAQKDIIKQLLVINFDVNLQFFEFLENSYLLGYF